MGVALDIGTALVFAALIYTSWKKGLARSVIELAGYIAACAVSYLFSVPVGNWIYSAIVRPVVFGQVKGYVQTSGYAAAAVNAGAGPFRLQNFLSKIPDGLAPLLSGYHLNGADLFRLAGNTAGTGADAVANGIAGAVAAPIGMAISRGFAFALLFALCMVAVRFAAGVSDRLFRLPVIGTFNRLGGAAVGAVKAFIILFLVTAVIALLVPMLSLQKNPPLTANTIAGTRLFKTVYDWNPITHILLNIK